MSVPSRDPEVITEQALAAYRAFQRMATTLSNFASAIAGKPVTVAASHKGTYTDGTTLHVKVPIEFGRMPEHMRTLCEVRDEYDISMCPACSVREEVTGRLYHEISHVAYGSFDTVNPPKAEGMLNSFGLPEVAAKVGKHLRTTMLRNTPKSVCEIVSDYVPFIWQGIEDVRVDTAMANIRPGMLAIRRAMTHRALSEAQEAGRIEEMDLNTQAVFGLLLSASYVSHEGILHPYVSQTLDMEDIQEVIYAAGEGDDVTDSVALSILFEHRMQAYGFFEPEETEDGGEGESDEGSDDSSDADEGAEGAEGGEGDEPGDGETGEPSPEGGPGSPSEGDNRGAEGDAPADGSVQREGSGSPDEGEDGDADGSDDAAEGDGGDGEDVERDGEASDEAGASAGDDVNDERTEPARLEESLSRPEEADFTDAKSRLGELINEVINHDPTTDVAEDQAMEAVVETADHFDAPSTMLSKINEIRDGGRPGLGVKLSVSEGIIGPALLTMRAAFEENKRAKYDRNRRSGRVSSSVLGRRAWNDDPRLFHRKVVPGKRDYAVLIGIDMSGSTGGSIENLEKQAAFAQAELCSRIGIKFAVYAHSGSHGGIFGREEGNSLDIWVVKEFDQPWDPKAKDRMAGLHAHEMNLDGHTMEYYRKALMRVQATDRVLMYYSDGAMPAENYHEELALLKQQIKLCERDGVVLMAVGARTDDPKRHGLDTVRLDSMSDITKVVRHLGARLTTL